MKLDDISNRTGPAEFASKRDITEHGHQ